MDRVYLNKIDWQNQPSTSTALGATNLKKMDNALYAIDERVVGMDTTKAEVTAINPLIKSVTYNNATGTLTFTHQNGTTTVIDTAMEKIVTNFSYNSAKQSIDLTLADGTTQSIDISAFVTNVDFATSNTIQFSVDANGKTKADVINGSITAEKLQTNYLADCQAAKTNADNSANTAKRYAVGGVVAGDATDNAKYYKEQAEIAKNEAVAIVGLTIDPEPVIGSYNPIAGKAVAEQIATAEGSFLNLANTLNGGLRVLVKGKLTDVGTGTKSPDNPYTLKGVGESGTVKVTACGKNFIPTPYKDTTKTVQGVTFTLQSDYSLLANGTSTGSGTDFYLFGQTTDNGNYVFIPKGDYDVSKLKSTASLALICSEKTYGNIYSADGLKTLLSQQDCYLYRIMLRVSNGTTINTTIYPMIELGSVATTYEPYKGKTAPVTFTTPIFDGDTIEKRNGVWGIYRDKMKSVFQGTANEEWITSASWNNETTMCFKISVLGKNPESGNLVSNRFAYLENAYINTYTQAGVSGSTMSDGIFVRIMKTSLSTADVVGFKTWLSNHQSEFVFKLATPTWTPLTQTEQEQLNALCTFSGVTNIFTDDVLNPTLSVQYGKTDVAALAIYDDNKSDTLNRSDYLYKGDIVDNLAATVKGKALDATQGTALQTQITTLNESLIGVSYMIKKNGASIDSLVLETKIGTVKTYNVINCIGLPSSFVPDSDNNVYVTIYKYIENTDSATIVVKDTRSNQEVKITKLNGSYLNWEKYNMTTV